MKILHIVRHAEAADREKKSPDFKRPLVKRGAKDARAVARRLRKSGHKADYMVSSPAHRALETALVFAKELEFPSKEIEQVQAIYENADNASLLFLVQNIPASSSQAFLFGHDPSFSDFARYLIADFAGTMPKGAVISVGFDCETWTDVGPGAGKLLLFDYPISKPEKARRFKSLRRETAAMLAAAMDEKLSGMDPKAAKKMKAYTRKVSRRVAERFLALTPHLPAGTGIGDKNPRRTEGGPVDAGEK